MTPGGAIVASYADDHYEPIRELAGMTAVVAVGSMSGLDDQEALIEACDRYARTFICDSSSAVREHAAQLMGLRSQTLAELGRRQEAIRSVDDLLNAGLDDPTPDAALGIKALLTEFGALDPTLNERSLQDTLRWVKTALMSSMGSWLCRPEGPGPVDAEVAFMLSCAAIYDHMCATFPDLDQDADALAMLQEIAVETVRVAVGSRMRSAGEAPAAELSNGVAEAMAAARLAAAGQARDVLIATSIMSQGQECEWPWARQPETPGHLWLLPAISSALCSRDLFRNDALALAVPPCYLAHAVAVRVPLIAEVHALRPGLSDAARRDFVQWTGSEFGAFLTKENWPDLVLDGETVANVLHPVAPALGVDPAIGDEECWSFADVIDKARKYAGDPAIGDDDSRYAAASAELEMAHLVYWTASQSHLLLDAGDDLAAVEREHPWVIDWYRASRPGGLWPPDRDLLGEASEQDRQHRP